MDAFISHVQEDAQIAKAVADGLESAGYTTWYYERDTDFRPFTEQIFDALVNSRAFVLIISKNSIKAHQVTTEVAQASIRNRVFIPLLHEITWDEFEKLGEKQWRLAIGASAALEITFQNLPNVLPRIFTGLEAMGIAPGARNIHSQVYNQYPQPLAAAYERILGLAGTRYQEMQMHEGMRDIPYAVSRFLSAIVLSDYRSKIGSVDDSREDQDVESQLKDIAFAKLRGLTDLLHTILGLYPDSQDALIKSIYTFFNDKKLRNNTVSEAVVKIREWVGATSQSKPPYSYEDLFEAISVYDSHPDGWGKHETAFAPGEYGKRNETLRLAFEKMLADLEFLTRFRLVYVHEGGRGIVYDATGPAIAPVSEQISLPKGLEPGHVYFCRKTDDLILEPGFDLDPLLACQECNSCRSLNLFSPGLGANNILVLISHGCGHVQAIPAQKQKEFERFISISLWHADKVNAGAASQPYQMALREMLVEGQIPPDNRQKLDFLAKILNITPEVQLQLETQALAEAALVITSQPAEPTLVQLDPVLDPDLVEDAGEDEKIEIAPLEEQSVQKLSLQWSRSLAEPLSQVGFFGDQPLIFGVSTAGNVTVLTAGQQLVYQESVETSPYSFLANDDHVILSTWEGNLYVFGRRELLWQSDPGSPVSALAHYDGASFLVGLWDGRVILYQSDGQVIWTAQLEDGVSSLAASMDGNHIAAGSYGGLVKIFDRAGKTQWMRDLGSGITRLSFMHRKNEMLVTAQDHTLVRIRVDDQHTYWRKNLGAPIQSILLSPNDRHLWATSVEGRVYYFNINGEIHLRGDYPIAGIKGGHLYPFSSEGSIALFFSDLSGIHFIDQRKKALVQEIDIPMQGAAISKDGQYTLTFGGNTLVLFSLRRPNIKVIVQALDTLKPGAFTRVQVRLKNTGLCAAGQVRLELEGPFKSTPFACPEQLKAGETATLENLSFQPLSEGAIPVVVQLHYQDDLGIDYEQADQLIVDPTAKPASKQKKENPR